MTAQQRVATPWRWRAASLASLFFLLVGFVFAATMRPTPGPYEVDAVYPFGDALRTWQVTVGFDWLAFGILFGAAALMAPRVPSRWFRVAVVASGLLILVPHAVIAAAIVLQG